MPRTQGACEGKRELLAKIAESVVIRGTRVRRKPQFKTKLEKY